MNLKPKAAFVKDELNAERLTPLQWEGIMRVMGKYALHFHDVQRKANGVDVSQEKTSHKHIVNNRTWSVDEIVEELKDIDAFDAAKYFFDKYSG
jgi:hypothetical protein